MAIAKVLSYGCACMNKQFSNIACVRGFMPLRCTETHYCDK